MARMMNNKKEKKSIVENSKRSVLQVIFSRTMLIMLLILLQFAYLIGRMYAFAEYVPIFLGSELLVVAIMMTIIINSKENPMIRLSWCILVGVFPILGSVVYVVLKFDLGYRVQQRRIIETEAAAEHYLRNQDAVLEEVKNKDMQTYQIAGYLRKHSASTINKNTDVTYFPIGEEMFEAMVTQLKQAEKFIFLEYFMISYGHMWNTILNVLIEKAKEGVEVRLLYDGSCAVYLLPYDYPKHIEELGIQCRMFSAPIPFISTHYNNRDHRKIMVIDGRVAFTGGVNLCDEYINRNSPCGHWKDVGIMVQGDAVRDFTLMFLQMWSATERKPVTRELLLETNVEKYLADARECAEQKISESGYVIPYRDSPVDKENVGEMVYLDILNQAKDYVYIMTPYLILDHEMQTALSFAAKRGVDVRIILPHIPDKKYAFVLAKGHYAELLAAGVKIYEYTPGFVHAKMFVSDNCRAVVGTVNLDYRSLYWHYECSAYLYQIPAIRNMVTDVKNTLQECQQITMEDVKNRKLASKLAGALFKLVAPLM